MCEILGHVPSASPPDDLLRLEALSVGSKFKQLSSSLWPVLIAETGAKLVGSDNPGECMHQQNMSDMAGSPDGLDLDENSDWLHTNDSYVRGTRHEGTTSTPTDRAADRDSVAVLTNVDSQDIPGAENVPNSPSANNNNKQRKRERERARYAAMSQEEKNAKKT
ncbi:uncharacterized protein LOC120702701 isoform X2 [Panicum virgatum]|uniref:Uncharacterized protein n=1 Tax=Panicum virgatum TaxID=38727 RepID=A0A8T0TKG1_PANVG|nr:uncharacterized protein LOC120702701 isoform X2 [Panicum virgatum]KAG2609605.1 hypothetical protein PVAP13_4KG052900 [Panicum virgatum]